MLKLVTLWVSIYQRSHSNPDLTGSTPTSPDAEVGNFIGKYLLLKTTKLTQVTDKLYHNVVSSTPRHELVRTHNFSGDRH